MSKIDLNFLDFMLNPSDSKINDIISWSKEAYIEEYGEQYRDKISDNILKTNFIFLNDSNSLETFINFLVKMQLHNIEEELTEFLKDNNTSFTLNLKKFKNKVQEKELKIISISEILLELTNILKELKKNCNIDEDIKIIKKIFNYIDENIFYFIKFDKLINEKRELLREIKEKKKRYKRKLQKEFFKIHSHFLSDEEYKEIFEENQEISSIIENSKKLSFYFNDFFVNSILNLGPISMFDKKYDKESIWIKFRRKNLEEWGISFSEEDLLSSEICLSKLKTYMYEKFGIPQFYHFNDLDILKDDIDDYNKKYKEYCDSIDFYLMSKNNFSENYIISDKTLTKKSNEHISFLTLDSDFCDEINELVLKKIENHFLKDCAAFFSSISFTCSNAGMGIGHDYLYSFIVIPTIMGVINYNKNTFFNALLFLLFHELGHCVVVDKIGQSGFNINNKITNLNELFNDYLAKKITNRLLMFIPKNINDFVKKNYSLHNINYFLIEPFISDYENIFKDASINNNLTILTELFGTELFEEYIALINEFYSKQKEYKDANSIFEEEADYVNSVKQKINNIYIKISKNKMVKR